jgi:hypothetical protein
MLSYDTLATVYYCCTGVQVWERVSPLLSDKPDVLAWLKRNTAPLKEQLAAAGAAAPAAAMAAV